MAASFDNAIDTILAHEGGFADNPNDPGGTTNFGISLRFAQRYLGLELDLDGDGDVDEDDIRLMSPEEAIEIYYDHWWVRNSYDRIDAQEVATKIFDLAVNMGSRQAHRLLQRGCRACGWTLLDDGLLGPKSMHAINSIRPAQLLIAMRSEAAGFYRQLASQKTEFHEFLNGWLNRAYS